MSKRFVVDLAERTVSTGAEVFVTLLLASWADLSAPVTRMALLEKAGLAAGAAALAVLKGGLAKLRGDSQSAAVVHA